jgi:hypothetical protein
LQSIVDSYLVYVLFCLFLDALYDDLRNYSERRLESYERLEYTNEIARLSEKIIWLESKIDRLVDCEKMYEDRIDYWRGSYFKISDKYKKLVKVHRSCPKRAIILYR